MLTLLFPQVYYELSRVKREEYELAKAQWYKDTDPAIVKQLAKESKDGRSLLKNSPDHIKKPNSSFFLFVDNLFPARSSFP